MPSARARTGNLYAADYRNGIILELNVPSPRANVALLGSASASNGQESAPLAIDDDPESIWSAGGGAVQWLELTLDKFYLVDRIELVVTQAPAGEASHQIWGSAASGALTKLHEYIDAPHFRRADSGDTGRSTLDLGSCYGPYYPEPQLDSLA